jgi:hypothetical protein
VDVGVDADVTAEFVPGRAAVGFAAVDGGGVERMVDVVRGVAGVVVAAEVRDRLGLGLDSETARLRAGADERVDAVAAPMVGDDPVLEVCCGCTNT